MSSSSELNPGGEVKVTLAPFYGSAEHSPADKAPADCVPMEYDDARGSDEKPEAQMDAAEAETATPEIEPQPDPGPTLEELVSQQVAAARGEIAAEARAEIEREAQKMRAALGSVIGEFGDQREAYFQQVEGEVVQLALAIARRILHRESQIDARLLAGLVHHELEQMERATTVRLFVAPESLASWRELVTAMPRPVELASERGLAGGVVRIESSLGATVIDFEGELKEIERGFFDLLAHRPVGGDSTAARVQ